MLKVYKDSSIPFKTIRHSLRFYETLSWFSKTVQDACGSLSEVFALHHDFLRRLKSTMDFSKLHKTLQNLFTTFKTSLWLEAWNSADSCLLGHFSSVIYFNSPTWERRSPHLCSHIFSVLCRSSYSDWLQYRRSSQQYLEDDVFKKTTIGLIAGVECKRPRDFCGPFIQFSGILLSRILKNQLLVLTQLSSVGGG